MALLALIAALPGFVVVWLMSAPLLSPAVSLAWLVNASCVALLAWWLRARRLPDRLSLWDIAGIYAFIGLAVGMTSEPEQIMQTFGLATPPVP